MNNIAPVQNTNTIRYADFFRLTTPTGTYLFSTAPYAITVPSISSSPFSGLGQLVQVNSAQRDIKSTANETTVTLVGIDVSMLGVVLADKIKGSKIELWHGFFGQENNLISNMLTYSTTMDGPIWNTYCGSYANTTPFTTEVVAPNGTYTALKIDRDSTTACGAGGSWGLLYNGGVSKLVVGKTYTVSVWARSASGSKNFSVGFNDSLSNAFTMTSEWKRVFMTAVATASDRGFQFIIQSGSGVCYFWGAQLQEGDLTDYVATTTEPNAGLYQYFNGYVNTFAISEEWMEEAREFTGVVTLSASSFQLILQNRTAGRFTNDAAWKSFNSTDSSMNRVNFISTINYQFGKTPS